MINMKKSAVAVALLGLGFAGMGTAQAATCATVGACFNFTGGSIVNGVPASGSWFSMLASDTNSDGIPDQNVYTAMRGAGTTSNTAPASNGFLNFSEINTLSVGGGTGVYNPTTGLTSYHNAGNMIDRDWSFFGGFGAHYTNQVLEVTGTGTTRSVNMAGWTVGWNSGSIDMGAGAAAVLSAGLDGAWGTGDETLDYSATVPSGAFTGVQYAVHLVGAYTPAAVPVPAAIWLLGSGLIGLVGVARRRKALVA